LLVWALKPQYDKRLPNEIFSFLFNESSPVGDAWNPISKLLVFVRFISASGIYSNMLILSGDWPLT
jgi:hypothetical protein